MASREGYVRDLPSHKRRRLQREAASNIGSTVLDISDLDEATIINIWRNTPAKVREAVVGNTEFRSTLFESFESEESWNTFVEAGNRHCEHVSEAHEETRNRRKDQRQARQGGQRANQTAGKKGREENVTSASAVEGKGRKLRPRQYNVLPPGAEAQTTSLSHEESVLDSTENIVAGREDQTGKRRKGDTNTDSSNSNANSDTEEESTTGVASVTDNPANDAVVSNSHVDFEELCTNNADDLTAEADSGGSNAFHTAESPFDDVSSVIAADANARVQELGGSPAISEQGLETTGAVVGDDNADDNFRPKEEPAEEEPAEEEEIMATSSTTSLQLARNHQSLALSTLDPWEGYVDRPNRFGASISISKAKVIMALVGERRVDKAWDQMEKLIHKMEEWNMVDLVKRFWDGIGGGHAYSHEAAGQHSVSLLTDVPIATLELQFNDGFVGRARICCAMMELAQMYDDCDRLIDLDQARQLGLAGDGIDKKSIFLAYCCISKRQGNIEDWKYLRKHNGKQADNEKRQWRRTMAAGKTLFRYVKQFSIGILLLFPKSYTPEYFKVESDFTAEMTIDALANGPEGNPFRGVLKRLGDELREVIKFTEYDSLRPQQMAKIYNRVTPQFLAARFNSVFCLATSVSSFITWDKEALRIAPSKQVERHCLKWPPQVDQTDFVGPVHGEHICLDDFKTMRNGNCLSLAAFQVCCAELRSLPINQHHYDNVDIGPILDFETLKTAIKDGQYSLAGRVIFSPHKTYLHPLRHLGDWVVLSLRFGAEPPTLILHHGVPSRKQDPKIDKELLDEMKQMVEHIYEGDLRFSTRVEVIDCNAPRVDSGLIVLSWIEKSLRKGEVDLGWIDTQTARMERAHGLLIATWSAWQRAAAKSIEEYQAARSGVDTSNARKV